MTVMRITCLGLWLFENLQSLLNGCPANWTPGEELSTGVAGVVVPTRQYHAVLLARGTH